MAILSRDGVDTILPATARGTDYSQRSFGTICSRRGSETPFIAGREHAGGPGPADDEAALTVLWE